MCGPTEQIDVKTTQYNKRNTHTYTHLDRQEGSTNGEMKIKIIIIIMVKDECNFAI